MTFKRYDCSTLAGRDSVLDLLMYAPACVRAMETRGRYDDEYVEAWLEGFCKRHAPHTDADDWIDAFCASHAVQRDDRPLDRVVNADWVLEGMDFGPSREKIRGIVDGGRCF